MRNKWNQLDNVDLKDSIFQKENQYTSKYVKYYIE